MNKSINHNLVALVICDRCGIAVVRPDLERRLCVLCPQCKSTPALRYYASALPVYTRVLKKEKKKYEP